MHLSANEIKEVVRTEELKKYYPLGTHTVKALDGVNLTVKYAAAYVRSIGCANIRRSLY